MKNVKKTSWGRYALSLLIFACAMACESPLEKLNPDQFIGRLTILVGVEMDIRQVNGRSQAVATDDFKVEIRNANDEVYLAFNRLADMPASIPVGPGTYYVHVESPNNTLPAFDNPKYSGLSEMFTINYEEEKQVSVTVSLSNCFISVIYSQEVVDNFSDYYTVISNTEGSLTYVKDEIRAGYYGLIPITIETYLDYLLPDGSLATKFINGEILNPQAKTHYEIHINSSLGQGMVAISVVADESYITELIQIGDPQPVINEGDIGYGDLLITEIMYNPAAISDTEGEWFEVYNNTAAAIDINQLAILKGTELQHVIVESIVINPNQYLVLARNANATTTASYIYGSALTLTNTADEIVIANYGSDGTDGSTIASVNYGSGGFPVANGASLNLDLNAFDPDLALLGANWCLSTLAFDTGDLGSPGIENTSCTN